MRTQSKKLPLALILILLSVNIKAQNETGNSIKWSPEQLIKIKVVNDVQVSPDGKKVAFSVRKPVMTEDKSEYLTHIYIKTPQNEDAYQFTYGDKSCSNPSWSPDGKWLAFTSSRSGENNIWIIPSYGGEAFQATDLKSELGEFSWAPNSRQIAFMLKDKETEEDEKNNKGKDDARRVDQNYKMSHLWLVDLDIRKDGKYESRQLTSGDYNIFQGFGGKAFDWSPDGQLIAFTFSPTPKVNDWTKTDISLLEIESGNITPVASTGAAESSPHFSPDGKWIAYTASDDPPTWAFSSRVNIVRVDGGSPKVLARTYDERPGIIGWTSNSKEILYSEIYRTVGRLYSLPIDGDHYKALTPEDFMMNNVSVNHSRDVIGFVSQSYDKPTDAYISNLLDFKPVKVSNIHDIPDNALGKTEIIQWKSTDGREIEGLLTYPVGYQSGTKTPLVVIVHGGPAGVFVRRFIGNRGAYPIAAFVSQGYAVLRCNVRGSSGYGKEFRYSNYGDWGGGDFLDIMSGIDQLVEQGVADPQALGIMGWSYGGYMTSSVITKTDRFKAASVGAGVTNLMSFTGTADIPGFLPDYFGGEYWDVMKNWSSHSAMFNIKGVSTPTLIQHGEKDLRVPVSQGYELYNALYRQNIPVEMIIYPRQPHGIREPKLLVDAMQSNLDWFNKWIMKGEKIKSK